MNIMRLIAYSTTALLLSACKVEIDVPAGGAVISDDFNHICLSGQTCMLDVDPDTAPFNLVAIAAPGYEFSHWQEGHRQLCAGSVSINCPMGTDAQWIDHALQEELMSSEHTFLLAPVFEQTGDATPESWYGLTDELGVTTEVLEALVH